MVSVIMPVYNSEKYLSLAVESILNQTYKDFELLLINDGSTDNSLAICLKYQESDNRVKTITKENGGLCSARNIGISNASGKYIAFIDNDDEFEPEYLEMAVKNLEDSDADIFRCNRKRIQSFDDGTTKIDVSGVPEYNSYPHLAQSEEIFKDYYKIKMSGAMYGIWNGVYKTELFKNINFDVNIRCGGEDWLVNLQLYSLARRVVFVNDALYVYNRRVSHSTSAKFNFNRIDAIIWVSEYEDKLLKDKLGSSSENLRRAMNAIYLVQTVKILEHPNCLLSKKDKYKYLRQLKDRKVFLGDCRTRLMKKPVKENVCLWLYSHNHMRIMYSIIAMILKKRGNS